MSTEQKGSISMTIGKNNKNYLALRVQLFFHSIRLAILSFEEYIDKTDIACLLLVRD